MKESYNPRVYTKGLEEAAKWKTTGLLKNIIRADLVNCRDLFERMGEILIIVGTWVEISNNR